MLCQNIIINQYLNTLARSLLYIMVDSKMKGENMEKQMKWNRTDIRTTMGYMYIADCELCGRRVSISVHIDDICPDSPIMEDLEHLDVLCPRCEKKYRA